MWTILNLELCDKNVKLLNKKILKVKERQRKIQIDKKVPPEAMGHFYNELFEVNLVLPNFSSDDLRLLGRTLPVLY